jgi:predicted TIM-barrel fold metal-dependent hydrolase
MPIIDTHTHAWPDPLAPTAISQVGELGSIVAHYDGTVAGLTASMDRAGVDRSVLLPVATKASQVRTINEWVVGLAGDRIVPFGAMHPDVADPGDEIDRLCAAGVRGFKMHPEYQSFEPTEPRLQPIYRAAVEQRMTIYFHAGGDVAFDSVRGTPASFVDVLDDWPELRIVLAHMGGFRVWPGVRERLAGRDVWIDTAYTLGHLPDDEFVALARAHGVDRVLFGSDGPWTDSKAELAHLRRLPFTAVELAGIIGGNAERLLSDQP